MNEETNRTKALRWWRSLSINEQNKLMAFYFPRYPRYCIITSSNRIEDMWKEEQSNDDIVSLKE
jgi:hypothetical protein